MKDELIKIIPRSKPELSKKYKILFWLALVLLFILGGCFFLLREKSSQLIRQKEKMEERIAQIEKEAEEEKELITASRKIKDFSSILKEHKKASALLDFLKQNCHQKVRFITLQINLKDFRLSLSGETENYKILGEQILKLKENSFVRDLQVTTIFLNRSNKVEFNLSFIFSPELIKP